MHFPVTLDIKPSRRLRAALVFVHSVAAVAPWVSNIGSSVAILLSLLCGFSLFFYLRRPCFARLRLNDDGSLHCQSSDGGEMVPAEILPGIVAYRWLLVARLRIDGNAKARPLVLLADSLNPEEFRGLRIWFRWLAVFSASAVRA